MRSAPVILLLKMTQMRKPSKKWKRAYDLYVNCNFTIYMVSLTLRISCETLEQWRFKFNWDRHRTLVMLNSNNMSKLYLERITEIINHAAEYSRGLNEQELKTIAILTRGHYHMQKKPTPSALTAVLVDFYTQVHQNKPALGGQIRGQLRQFFERALQYYYPKTSTPAAMVALPDRKAKALDKWQYASLPG
jgi:hypothetical protein